MTLLLLSAACTGPKPVDTRDTDPVDDSGPESGVDSTIPDSGESGESGETAAPDADGDGVPDAEDCAPDDPYTFPGAEEWCDPVDHDCDGEALPAGVCGKPQRVEALDGASRITAPDNLEYMGPVHFMGDLDGEPGQELGIETATPSSYGPEFWYTTMAFVSAPLPSEDTTLTEAATHFLVSYGGEALDHWLPAGDFDGDGAEDVVAVSYGYAYPGRAYLLRGPMTDWPHTVAVEDQAAAWWEQLEPGDVFGYDADAGGDANGDGLTDIIVSAELNEEAQTLLFFGRPDGLVQGMDTAAETLNTGNGREYVAFSGDQDGDGLDDVRMVPGYLAWVSGADITPGAHEDWTAYQKEHLIGGAGTTGCAEDGSGGGRTPRLGDWDRDGLDDIGVHCHSDEWSPDGEGDSYLFISGDTLVRAPADATLHDLATGSWNMEPWWLGASRRDTGDLDGDGANEILVIAREEYDHDDVAPDTTRASTVVLLSSDGPPAPWTDPTTRGWSLRSDAYDPDGTYLFSAAGDFDGDGLADMAVAARQAGYSSPSHAWLVPNWGIPWDDASLFAAP